MFNTGGQHTLELLAPAGNWDALVAALENGADAVYLGGKAFSARQFADNFTLDMIKKAVEYAHLRDAKIYVTVNTLLHSRELNEVLDYVFELYNLDVDAVIIQDLGLLNLLRELLPDLAVHASTQMTVHNAEGVNLLQQQGVKRVVLARELTLDEIRTIRNSVTAELEIFVHGALCYSYSGQCLFSSIVGGRSGNRGRCAQPCRLPYTLYAANGNRQDSAGKYLLSLADQALIEYLPVLQEIGIHSLKIEGRMKRPEYVAIVTRSYRQFIDQIAEGKTAADPQALKGEMAKVFNRTFSPGYLDPQVPKRLSTQRPNNRGVYIGRVISQDARARTAIRLQEPLSLGDGVEIWVSHGQGPAFTVERMEIQGRAVTRAEAGETVILQVDQKVHPHDRVFKTHDERLISSARASYEGVSYPEVPVDVEVYLQEGEPMQVVYRTAGGQEAAAATRSLVQKAQQQPLDKDTLADKLGRLGNTPFKLRSLTLEGTGNLIVPFSEINQARRDAVDRLYQLVVKRHQRQITSAEFEPKKQQVLAAALKGNTGAKNKTKLPQLRVMVNSTEAALQALEAGAERVYLALEGLGNHRRPRPEEIKAITREASHRGSEVIPALPRIRKPGDSFDYTRLIQEAGCTQVMAGDLGGIYWCRSQGIPFWADYSLNVLNPVALTLLQSWGARGVCASPELNLNQLREFPDLTDVELLVYGELVLMVSQTCVLYEVLENKNKCSHWCLRDQYYIQDEKGYAFPVAGDADCRFYVFNSRTLSMLDDLSKLVPLSPGALRLEMRRSSARQVGQVVRIFRKALANIAADQPEENESLKNLLARYSPSGFTKCHYYRGVE